MIRSTLLCMMITSLAAPAWSLSCMTPDVTKSFEQARQAEEPYIIVTGILTFDDRKLPKAVVNDSPPLTRIPAHFDGMALTTGGFDYDFDRDVTLEVACFGPWCGGAGSGVTYLAFLRKEADGYVVGADPCSSMMFPSPSQEVLDVVAKCYKIGRCEGE